MIVVTSATGNIGKAIVFNLRALGQKVRALARDAKKLKPLAEAGAETEVVDLADVEAVTRAFTGAQAAFLLIPPHYGTPNLRAYYNAIGSVYNEAVAKAGVSHVVSLSSVGAHLTEKTGPIKGLHDQEQRLNKLNAHVLHLRPSYFMENLFFSIGLIKSMGIIGSPIGAGVRFPMIATRDIAEVGARKLAAQDFNGKSVLELLGPRDVTMAEATKAIGMEIGKPALPYVQIPCEEAYQSMVEMGLSPDVANQFNEMYRGFNEGVIVPTQLRDGKTTTPTTIEDFAKVFAAVYSK